MLLVVMALPMMVACGDDDEKDSTPDSGSYSSMTKYDKQKLDSLAKIYGKTYTVSLDEAGSLEYKLSLLNVDIKRITGLQISGKMNGSDIKYLHYLNNLVVLDMSESQIVDGGSYMFYDCTSLETPPVIPKGIKNCMFMFNGCSEPTQEAGNWNIENRGKDYYIDGPGKSLTHTSESSEDKNQSIADKLVNLAKF